MTTCTKVKVSSDIPRIMDSPLCRMRCGTVHALSSPPLGRRLCAAARPPRRCRAARSGAPDPRPASGSGSAVALSPCSKRAAAGPQRTDRPPRRRGSSAAPHRPPAPAPAPCRDSRALAGGWRPIARTAPARRPGWLPSSAARPCSSWRSASRSACLEGGRAAIAWASARAVAALGRDQATDEPGARRGVGILCRAVERLLRGGVGAGEIAAAIGRRRLHQEQLRGHWHAPPVEIGARLAHRDERRLGIARLHLGKGEVVGDVGDGAGIVALVGARQRHLVLRAPPRSACPSTAPACRRCWPGRA